MEIRTRDIKVEDLIKGAEYLGCGASKEAYLKDGIVYKVPRGRFLIQQGGFNCNLHWPSKMEEVDEFLEEVDAYEPALVWPLGQFATELVVWNAIQDLRAKGTEVNCFAEIKDYYFDKNGIIVIEQEYTDGELGWDNDTEHLWDEMKEEIKKIEPIFITEYGISLREVRDGNCGSVHGKLKEFDFALSTTTQLDDYGSYSDFEEESYDEYNSCEGSY